MNTLLKLVKKNPLIIFGKVTRRILLYISDALMLPASKNGFLSSLYFLLLSRKFDREHKAVLAGILAYKGSKICEKESFGGFRRNIHRLEKALTMLPRRPVFAEGYIKETVDQYASAIETDSCIHREELTWAYDVLVEYFREVENSIVIEAARSKFYQLEHPKYYSESPMTPYAQRELEASGVSFDKLYKLFVERRSVRWFERKRVDKTLVERAIAAASLAPTACNRLPYRFHVFFGERAVEVAKLAGGTAGWADNIPCLIVVVGDLSNYIETRDRHLIYIDASLASMQLMLALQTLGLSNVPINWPDVDEREERMQNSLKLELFERPIMLIGVGYAREDGMIPYSPKKPTSILMVTN